MRLGYLVLAPSFLCCLLALNHNARGQNRPKRFFSERSVWNQPIGDNPEIDPRSDRWIELLNTEPAGRRSFGINCNKWTIPVYEVHSNTPMYHVGFQYLTETQKSVWNTVRDNARFGFGPQFNPMPIPEDALPDPESDAHYVVYDWERKLAWDCWRLRKRPDGSWESNTGMFYRLDGDGTFDGEKLGYVDGESVHFHGPSRAAGVPALAGLIMYDEVMAGEIRHKLCCAMRYSGLREFCRPASWTDGFVKGGIPHGAVIQLDPQLDLDKYDLTREERIVCQALQQYGMIAVDVAQGQPIYAEGLWGHPDKSWEGKLRHWGGGILAITFDKYRVLKVKNPVHQGDSRVENMPYWTMSPEHE